MLEGEVLERIIAKSLETLKKGIGMSPTISEVKNECVKLIKEVRLFSEECVTLDIDKIRIPDSRQHRFDEDSIQNLATNIRDRGLLQPILVSTKDSDGKHQLVAGYRRLLACNLLGMSHIIARTLNMPVVEAVPEKLIECLKAKILNPIDQALALSALLQDFGFTYEHLTELLFASRESLVSVLRLLKLEVPIQRAVANGLITPEHAALILKIDNANERFFLLKKLIENQLSLSALEGYVNQLVLKRKLPNLQCKFVQKTFDAVVSELKQRLSTEVSITQPSKGGKITIEFLDVEDLSRILRLLGVEITTI